MKTIDELKKYSGRTDESKNVTGDITIINVKNNPVAFAQQVVDIVDGKSKDQSTINTELQASIDSVKELIPDTQELTTTVKSAIVDSAPETLDTLNELAAALGDDENFAATVAEELGKKVNKEAFENEIFNIYSLFNYADDNLVSTYVNDKFDNL